VDGLRETKLHTGKAMEQVDHWRGWLRVVTQGDGLNEQPHGLARPPAYVSWAINASTEPHVALIWITTSAASVQGAASEKYWYCCSNRYSGSYAPEVNTSTFGGYKVATTEKFAFAGTPRTSM